MARPLIINNHRSEVLSPISFDKEAHLIICET
jgi:hypothetical protein